MRGSWTSFRQLSVYAVVHHDAIFSLENNKFV